MKNLIFVSLFVTIVIVMSACSGHQHYDVPYFKDGRFQNETPTPKKNILSYFWMRLNTTQEKWEMDVPLQDNIILPQESSEDLRVHFINHSTFLIQIDNVNILTDPIFSERASPLSWAGPKRAMPPGLKMEEIPKIDVIIISHDHYDHFDVDTLKFFINRDSPKILFGLGVAKRIDNYENAIEMGWWDDVNIKKIRFTFTPALHWSARGIFDRKSTLWGSFMIETQNKNIYFAGDTGMSSHFAKIAKKFPNIDLAFLPIGAYEPRYFMKIHHMNPSDAVEAKKILNANHAIGMHWGTFQLTNEGRMAPAKYFEDNPTPNFMVPHNGDCFDSSIIACKN